MLFDSSVTVDDRDLLDDDQGEGECEVVADAEIEVALGSGHLSVSQAIWLHNEGRSWEICVEH